jgi:hypothetical protein
MQKANLSVVRRKPEVQVFDEHGEIIQKSSKRWRLKGENQWHSWSDPLPKGLIEISIEVENLIEKDEFFNIGPLLQLNIVRSSLQEAEISIGKNEFIFTINETPLLEIQSVQSDCFRLVRKDTTHLPKAILASLSARAQGRSLRFELVPPFKGFEIIDSKGLIVRDGYTFSVERLYGYRIISKQQDLVINLWNTKRPGIILSERLSEPAIPLMHFQEKVSQLYSLSDPLETNAEVILEISIDHHNWQQKLREYRICRYTQKIDAHWDENNQLVIQTSPHSPDLYAVPLDYPSKEIMLYDLEQTEDHYVFREQPQWEKCIVFSSSDSDVKIKSAFINLNKAETQVTPTDRLARIAEYRKSLEATQLLDEPWQQLIAYYDICLNNNLPFATFDVLRACGFSSELAGKLFLFLLCYDKSGSFIENTYRQIEDDLGFSFHWVAIKHWHLAFDWIGVNENPALYEIICDGINKLFSSQYPVSQFNIIRNYLFNNTRPNVQITIPWNQKINELRASLGPKVLSGIPQECPKVPEEFKNILPVTIDNSKVKLFLKSPVAAALSITGVNDNIWSEKGEYIRRNVKYSYQLNPEWYAEALVYSMSKI